MRRRGKRDKARFHDARRQRAPKGFTLGETIVTLVIVVLLVAAFVPMVRTLGSGGLRTVSLKNLVVLGEAQACYAADWHERQFSMAPKDLGTVNGNCFTYVSSVVCPNQALLGWSVSGAMWGYFIGSGLCVSFPGNCSNLMVYRPISFGGSEPGFGCFRIPSFRGFQEYVGSKFYEREWYSELDSVTWSVASTYFPAPDQFTSSGGTIAFPAYCTSPAALYNPGVFRRPSLGGFQNPDADFDDSYDAPSQAQCLYPDLKTRMVEHSWLVNPPAATNPAWSEPEPYYFNQGIASKPGCLFFDGSIAEMTMTQAVADDASMLKSTNGIDGLWSRDTPFGADGYFGAQAFDDTRNSFHILTTDGITGRDFLRRGRNGRQGGQP
ncbi:MAG: hypothetical protein U0572_17590 [Phycisphaerales bacterium]